MSEIERLTRLLRESADPANPTAEELRDIVTRIQTVAVVGLSRDPMKAARRVPSYLAAKGMEVLPVNPFAERILGRPSRNRLEEVDEPLDLVLVFRPSEEAGAVLASAAARPENPVIWLQEGIQADSEARRARAEHRIVVQDLCIFKVHRSLEGSFPAAFPRR